MRTPYDKHTGRKTDGGAEALPECDSVCAMKSEFSLKLQFHLLLYISTFLPVLNMTFVDLCASSDREGPPADHANQRMFQ